jgi:CheY-like chemotaxis protein
MWETYGRIERASNPDPAGGGESQIVKQCSQQELGWMTPTPWAGLSSMSYSRVPAHRHQATDAMRQQAHADDHHIRVLLVDDHRMLREGIIGLLENQPDIEVVGEAGDGETAIDLARRLHPDVILMDVTMPRMGGIEATRRIATEMPDIRIVGLSMHEDEEMGRAMRRAGAVEYLPKDGPSQRLIRVIREV